MKIELLRYALTLAFVIAMGWSAIAAETQSELKSEAKITREEATKTALASVPNGKIKTAELEKEHGKLIWSFDISRPKTKNITEVQVDATTGKIVNTKVETPEEEAKEAGSETHEKTKP